MSSLGDFVLEKRAEVERSITTQAWKDESFKRELLSNPKEVLQKELGVQIPPGVKVQVVEEDETSICIVIPHKPPEEMANLEVEEELSDEALEAVAGGFFSEVGHNVGSLQSKYTTTALWGYDMLSSKFNIGGRI
jgi:hypothetical protein